MASISVEAAERLHEAMAARVEKGVMPGIVTVLARGEDVRIEAIGRMAFDGEPMRRDAIFRITSMTKPVLAATAMTLVEEGRIALDEPVDRLLPELAGRRVLRRIDGRLDDTVPAERPILVEDLLTFRVGHGMLTEPTMDPPFPIVLAANDLQLCMGPPDPRTPHAPDEWMARFATLPLMHQPGSRWQYNTGALVLGVLVARARGAPLEAVLRERILGPLGMVDTTLTLPAGHVHRLPTQYATDLRSGEIGESAISGPDRWTTPPAFPDGAAGLLATADDYLAFARMLIGGGLHRGRRVLTERSVELMTTNHLSPAQVGSSGLILSPLGWGYGMSVAVAPDEVSPTPGRYGWSGGYGSHWFNDPATGLIAIALTQCDTFMSQTLPEFQVLAGRA